MSQRAFALPTVHEVTIGGYWAEQYVSPIGLRYAVNEADGSPVDSFRTRSGAEYAARLLNRGLARVNHHALTGLRVEVI